MEGKVQLRGDVAVGHPLCDQVDNLQLGVGDGRQPVFARGWLTMRRCTPKDTRVN